MVIVSTGIGKIVAEFIENRLILLREAGVRLLVILNYGEPKLSQSEGIEYLPIHSFKKAKTFDNLSFLFKIFSKIIVKPINFIQLSRIAPLKFPYNFIWALERISFLDHTFADIIHVQWIGSVEQMYWLKSWFNAPIIASARGSQVTIYPYLDKKNLIHIQKCINLTDSVHCVSKSIVQAVRKLCPDYPPDKIFVNYNGVNTKIFHPVESFDVESSKRITLLSVGTFMWRKNFIAQFQLIFLLKKKNITNIKLLIVGGGEKTSEYQQIIQVLGINHLVEIRGYVRPEKIHEIYREGHIYISTSLAEGLSNSVMEACACGLPAVVFNCEGMEELIDDSETGYIIDPFDIEAMVNRCITLMEDSVLRRKMGIRAATKMKNQFDADYHTFEMVEQMKKIASNA